MNILASSCVVALSLVAVGPNVATRLGGRLQDPGQQKTLVLEEGDHELIDLVDRYARFLGRNCLFEPRELEHAGHVSLQTALELDRSTCEAAIEGLLYTKSFALVPNPSVPETQEVISMQGARRGEITARAVIMDVPEVLRHRARKLSVRCVVPLRNLDPVAAAERISGAMGRPVFITPLGKSLVVNGFADQVALTVELIAEIDAGAEAAAEAGKDTPVPSVRTQLEDLRAMFNALDKRVERLEFRK